MTIFLDVIWALNFLFDSLLLLLTALILKREYRYTRVFMGGFVGSFIILLMVTPFHSYSSHPFGKLFFSILMVLIVFGYKRFRYFLQNLFTFYLVTFLLGGSLIGIHYFIQFDSGLSLNLALRSIQGFGDPISWLFVLIGFPLAWHFSRATMDQLEVTKIQYDQIVDVSIRLANCQLKLKGLIDSGNQLYDPISKAPVMFVSVKGETNLPEDILKLATEAEKIILGDVQLDSSLEEKMRVIPYKVVGQDHQLILAMKPEVLEITKGEEIFIVDKGYISFTNQELASDGAFQCIIHPKMIASMKKEKSNPKVS